MFGIATVRVVRAEISREKNLIADMDPYAIIKTNAGEVKTSVAKGMGKTPSWIDSFNINLNGDPVIYIGLWDKETLTKDDVIGEATVNLVGNLNAGVYSAWHPLFYKGNPAGQVYVEVALNNTTAPITAPTNTVPAIHPVIVVPQQPQTLVDKIANVINPPNQAVGTSNTVTGHGTQLLSGMATLRVVRAELIREKNLITTMDPYAVIRTNAAEVQTNVATGQGKTPTWNNTFNISLAGDQILHISVFDKETLKDGLIAETTLNLGNSLNQGRFAGWQPLYYKGQPAGQIYLEIEAGSTNVTTIPPVATHL